MTDVNSSDQPLGSKVIELVAVMDRLRSPGGCPWDAEQTHQSLVEYLVEETYETIETIDAQDQPGLREELGDLLLQIVFHSRIAEEHPDAPWDIDDVAAGIADKLIARHPHVFGDEDVTVSSADVEAQWQARKALEKGRTSVTDGVPMAMPSMVLAPKLLGRARRGGVEVVIGSVEGQQAAADVITGLGRGEGSGTDRDEQFGDYLLGLIAAATAAGIDADTALRQAIGRVREQIVEQEGARRDGDLTS